MKNKTVIFNNLNEMVDIYGKVNLTIEELLDKNLTNILIKGEGYVSMTMLVSKDQAVSIINEDYSDVLEQRIEGYQGVYGYYGSSTALVNNIKYSTDDDSLVIFMEYEGPHFIVNSGLYEGMVIITGNFRNLKFSNILS